MTASPEPVTQAVQLPGAWEPAAHPKMAGFFCLVRWHGDKTEHYRSDDSVAMYWSRSEAARCAPKE